MKRKSKDYRRLQSKRLYERYLGVRLRLESCSFAEIGELLCRARQTINIYWKSYQEQRNVGLIWFSGQPPELTEEQR
ncbi:hypothetical protein [Paenibacillus sp. BJ-4]|uniref:hypothetical protein n=1 Tax=Paenibacillus sp. BJ-4 TaxID=2878097 RepID=UPI001CF0CFEB|nr:hypothetical protein [Paenibacillus sp. BJ-4]